MNIEIVKELIKKLELQQARLSRYNRYYEGEHDIIKNYKMSKRKSNIVEVHNYCKQFIDNNAGFLLGNGISVKYGKTTDLEDDSIVDIYNKNLGSYSQQMDQKLMIYQQIFGYTYEINYINKDGDFSYDIKSPLDMSVIRDGKKVVYGLLYKGVIPKSRLSKSNEQKTIKEYDFFDVRNNKIETYTHEIGSDNISMSKKSFTNIINNPIIVVKNDWNSISEIKDIISLNDAYNQISSDLTNEISDFRNAFLHLKGVKLTEEEAGKIGDGGIIITPGNSTDAKFLTKNINDNFVQNKLDQLEKRMYDAAGQVNFNDTNLGSNTSSLALRNKLTQQINRLKLKEGFLREGIYIRFKNYSEFLKSKSNLDDELNDYTSIDMKFILNIPTSDKETSEMLIELYDNQLVSRETTISMLSFIDDAREEMKRIDEEEYIKINNRVGKLFEDRILEGDKDEEDKQDV